MIIKKLKKLARRYWSMPSKYRVEDINGARFKIVLCGTRAVFETDIKGLFSDAHVLYNIPSAQSALIGYRYCREFEKYGHLIKYEPEQENEYRYVFLSETRGFNIKLMDNSTGIILNYSAELFIKNKELIENTSPIDSFKIGYIAGLANISNKKGAAYSKRQNIFLVVDNEK